MRDLRDAERRGTLLSFSSFDESEFFRLRERLNVGRVEGESGFIGREGSCRSRSTVLERVQSSSKASRFSLFELKLGPQNFVLLFEIRDSRRL